MDARTLEISKRSITELTRFIVSNSEKKGAKHYETGGLSLCKFFDGMFGSKVSMPVYNCCIHASNDSLTKSDKLSDAFRNKFNEVSKQFPQIQSL